MRFFDVYFKKGVVSSRLLILSCFYLLSGLGFSAMAQGNVEPVFSKALNAACIVVGNSNTKFADGTVSPIDESKEKGKLEYVFAKGLPKDTSVTVASGGTVKITNSSFSGFYLWCPCC